MSHRQLSHIQTTPGVKRKSGEGGGEMCGWRGDGGGAGDAGGEGGREGGRQRVFLSETSLNAVL